MLRLHLSCNQGGPTLSGRCICSNFVQACTSMGTVASMTKTYYLKDTTQNSNLMYLELWYAQVAFKMAPSFLAGVFVALLCKYAPLWAQWPAWSKHIIKRTQTRPKSGWFQGFEMLMLHLSCNQGGHTPSGRRICNNLAKVCTCVGTAATMTKTYYQKNTTLTSK